MLVPQSVLCLGESLAQEMVYELGTMLADELVWQSTVI